MNLLPGLAIYLYLVMCNKSDDDLVEVHVEPDYMAQNFHKMVNFKIKTNTENRIVKKISFGRKNSFDEDIGCLLRMGYKTSK